MDYYEALRILALRAVVKPSSDPDYHIRFICRWYSQTFHTPLKDVQEIPIDEILSHFYEHKYENMSEDDLYHETTKAILSDEEKKDINNKQDAEAASEEAFLKAAERQNKQLEELKNKNKNKEPDKKTLEDIKKLPPDIEMTFEDLPPEYDALLEQPSGPMPPPKKRP